MAPLAALMLLGTALFMLHRSEYSGGPGYPPIVMQYLNAEGPGGGQAAEAPVRAPRGWHIARDGGDAADSLTAEQQQQMEALSGLGYMSGYQSERDLPSGVTLYDSSRAFKGYNLAFSVIEPTAFLMDMDGGIVHEWNVGLNQVEFWPEAGDLENVMPIDQVMLFEDGDLMVLVRNLGLARFDRDSNLRWTSDFLGAHHDFDVDPDGNIYAIGKHVWIDSTYNTDEPILDELIVVLDSTGHTLRSISLRNAIAASSYAPVLRRMPPSGDIMHTNTVEYIEGDFERDISPLREGTLLVSILHLDLVCALDPETEEVYWAESDFWSKQHDPTLLENGNILLFDNHGNAEHSAVLEFDAASRSVEWYYGGGDANPFMSEIRGACQRLPNGNTLITESTEGRAFEIDADGSIVWEYYNPNRAGERREFIALLMEMKRIPADSVGSWLPGR